jgi:hypothetical protein
MLRAPGLRREIQQRLASYEIQLVLALFGGGMAADPAFIAATADEQRLWRRNYARDLARLRRLRTLLRRARTARAWRSSPPPASASQARRPSSSPSPASTPWNLRIPGTPAFVQNKKARRVTGALLVGEPCLLMCVKPRRVLDTARQSERWSGCFDLLFEDAGCVLQSLPLSPRLTGKFQATLNAGDRSQQKSVARPWPNKKGAPAGCAPCCFRQIPGG